MLYNDRTDIVSSSSIKIPCSSPPVRLGRPCPRTLAPAVGWDDVCATVRTWRSFLGSRVAHVRARNKVSFIFFPDDFPTSVWNKKKKKTNFIKPHFRYHRRDMTQRERCGERERNYILARVYMYIYILRYYYLLWCAIILLYILL